MESINKIGKEQFDFVHCKEEGDKDKEFVFIEDSWNDYSLRNQFRVCYKDKCIGYVKVCCNLDKKLSEIEYNVCEEVIKRWKEKDDSLKIWMIGRTAEFYFNLKKILGEENFKEWLRITNDVIFNIEEEKKLKESIPKENVTEIIQDSFYRFRIAETQFPNIKLFKALCLLFKEDRYKVITDTGFEHRKADLNKLVNSLEHLKETKNDWSIQYCLNRIIELGLNTDEVVNLLKSICVEFISQANESTVNYDTEGSSIVDKINADKLNEPRLTNNKLIDILVKLCLRLDSNDDLYKMLFFILDGDKNGKLINEIKDELAIVKKENIPNDLAQYTTLSSITHLIKQEDAKLRLTCLRQLNDPMEGKVITECIQKIDQKNNEKIYFNEDNSALLNVFVTSMTTSLDSLPMWKQYADNATGVMAFYSRDYIEKVIDAKNTTLYRVCYINSDKLKSACNRKENTNETSESFVYISKDSNGENEELRHKIENNLLQIFNSIKSPGKYQLIQKALLGIKYLFKDDDYAYENEFRVVINLNKEEEDNRKKLIECDDINNLTSTHPIPFLRTYLKDDEGKDIAVKYQKVILGPNSIDLDYMEPYIKFCDKDIGVEKSKINYRE